MVRNVIAEDSLLPYIQNLGKTEPCSIGLILGQSTAAKDYVIHFARTPQPAKKNVSEENLISSSESTAELRRKMAKFIDIPESWVGDHAKHATRMLPGGMYVLGIFISTIEDVFNVVHIAKIRNILSQMNKNLGLNPYLHGNPSFIEEKLVLIYNPSKESFTCKSIEFKSGSQKPVEFKFMAKSTKWHQLDCNYQFDHLIPITTDKVDWNLKKHLQAILATVEENLSRAVVMIDLEVRNENESLEAAGKKKQIKNKNSPRVEQPEKSLLVNIFVPCENAIELDDPIITTCSGDMHFEGQLAARVFLHQKATISEATQALKEDIVRSLAARLEMHWDSLIEEEAMSPEEKFSVHEPPRRVLVPLPASKITLSDYLFPGEGPSEALISLEELLDLTVHENDVIKDLELQAEPSDYCSIEKPINKNKSEENIPITSQTNKIIYYVLFGIFVLILALLIQFLRKYL